MTRLSIRPGFRADERGQDIIEWVLVAFLLALAAAALLLTLGGTVADGYADVDEWVAAERADALAEPFDDLLMRARIAGEEAPVRRVSARSVRPVTR